jgi:hypothetical protein
MENSLKLILFMNMPIFITKFSSYVLPSTVFNEVIVVDYVW